MALTPRQRILYQHAGDIWRPTRPQDASGFLIAITYTKIAIAAPMYWVTRISVEAPSLVGGLESDNLFSRDEIHLDGAQEIDADYIIKNVTLDADGTRSENYGRFWIVAGQPQSLSNQGRRRARMRKVQAVQIATPPAGVS